MKVWFEAMRNRQSDIIRLTKTVTWYIRVYSLAGTPFSPMSTFVVAPPNAWVQLALLHSDDLHGLPFREAPNRWLVTFYVMITLMSKVKINDALCSYQIPVVGLSEAERFD